MNRLENFSYKRGILYTECSVPNRFQKTMHYMKKGCSFAALAKLILISYTIDLSKAMGLFFSK